MAQTNPGEQDPSTQKAEPIEKKHLADPEQGRPEPSANPERAPQHTPGFEAKQKAEADKAKPKGEQDKPEHDTGHKPRAHTARAKQHVKRMAPRRHK